MTESQYKFRVSCLDEIVDGDIAKAVSLLGRDSTFVDRRGFTCDLLDAACNSERGLLAYVERKTRNRWWTSWVYCSIEIHLLDAEGKNRSVDIVSYNPYCGFELAFFKWIDDSALMIYHEKHDTYAVVFGGNSWPPVFKQIEDRWVISDDVLSYLKYNGDTVQELRIPCLTSLPDVSCEDAERIGRLPPDPYAK